MSGRLRLLVAAASGVAVGLVLAFAAWSLLRSGGDPTLVRLDREGVGERYASRFQPIQHRDYRGFEPALLAGDAPGDRLGFGFARAVGDRWSLAAVGDVMAHDSLQITAWTRRDAPGERAGGYGWLLAAARPFLADADLAIGNLETVVSDRFPRQGFPDFNADPVYLEALADLGFDAMTTANNHILDHGLPGLRDTEANLAASGIAFAGTDGAPREGILLEIASRTAREKLILGILAYTDSVNGSALDHIRRHDELAHVNYLCAGRERIFRAFVNWLAPRTCHTREAAFLDGVEASIAGLRARGADYVAVFVHRGRAYHYLPDEAERRQAAALAMRDADAVVGTGSHSIMPVERLHTRGGEVVEGPGDGTREHLVLHGLGNFVSTQGGASAYGMVARIDIGRDAGGRFVHAVTPHFAKSVLAIEEHPHGGREQKLEIYRLEMLDLDAFLAEVARKAVR